MPAPCFRVVGVPQFSCGIAGTFYKVLGGVVLYRRIAVHVEITRDSTFLNSRES